MNAGTVPLRPIRVLFSRPSPMLVLDFETYFDRQYSLRRMSIPEYIHDARFDVQGLAVRHPTGRAEFRPDVQAALGELTDQYGPRLEQVTVVMHNAYFDAAVLAWRYGLQPPVILDTMLMAHHVYGPKQDGGGSASLKDLATRFGLAAKGDLDFMAGVQHPTPGQLDELARYAVNDAEITFRIAERLRPRMTNPRVELPLIAHTVRLFTERQLSVDLGRIAVVEQLVRGHVNASIAATGATAQQISGNATFRTLLEDALAATGRAVPLKPGKLRSIPALAKSDGAMQALLADPDERVRRLARARLDKGSADATLSRLAKLGQMSTARGALAGGGGTTLPVHLVYCGAHTGRFAAAGGFNLQNLPAPGRAQSDHERQVATELRRCLRAVPGHKLVSVDASQIECRVLAWLAGQQDILDCFAQGRDLYSEFAAGTLGLEIRKPRAGDGPEVSARLTTLRQVGKEAVLGLGFQMGVEKFVERLRANPAVAALFAGGVLSDRACADLVYGYRGRYPGIEAFWRACDSGFRDAMQHGTGGAGPIALRAEGDGDGGTDLVARLPSGRELRYPAVRTEPPSGPKYYIDRDGRRACFQPIEPQLVYGRGSRISTYGGKITENFVQAVARDILAEAILRLERAGWPVFLHVHDEVVLQVPAERASACSEAAHAALSTPPSWAAGLVLGAEGRVTDDLFKS
jgi:DNA polymerase